MFSGLRIHTLTLEIIILFQEHKGSRNLGTNSAIKYPSRMVSETRALPFMGNAFEQGKTVPGN